jgi:hypothetical protein
MQDSKRGMLDGYQKEAYRERISTLPQSRLIRNALAMMRLDMITGTTNGH